jgi:hypothetical protein
MVAEILNSPGEFLQYGLMGAAAFFALCSFYLVQKLISTPLNKRPSPQPVYVFMVLTIAFICLGILSDWLKSSPEPEANVAAALDGIQGSVLNDIEAAAHHAKNAADNSSNPTDCSSNATNAMASAIAAHSTLQGYIPLLRRACLRGN